MALALHVAAMGSAVLSPATPLAQCCFQSTRSGLQQVRFLRKLMPGKGFYMDVLCYLLKAWKKCAVQAPIASCCHGSSCALLASCMYLTHPIVLFSLRAYLAGACFLPHDPQARRGVWKVEKSRVAFIQSFRIRAFCWTLRADACVRICVGIRAFWRCEKLKNFLARRGSASRPARPSSA